MTTTFHNPFRVLPAVIMSAVLMAIGYSTAGANPMRSDEKITACDEQQHGSVNDRLDKLAQQLEIKASQQAAWEAFAKAYKALASQQTKKPESDADAATFARYRAEMVTELAQNLTKIAEATAKLQASLSEDQRKVFNRIARHLHHRGGEWRHQQKHDENRGPHHGEESRDDHSDDHGA